MPGADRRPVPLARRRFVLVGLTAAAALGAMVTRWRREAQEAAMAFGRERFPRPVLDRTRPTGALTAPELACLLALADVLVSPERWPGREFFVDHVNHRTTREAGYLAQYRSGIGILNAAAQRASAPGARFDHLSREAREGVLNGLLWRYRSGDRLTRWLERILVSKRLRAFRQFVIADLLVEFYRSSHGWAVVGYSHYPGVPAADPLDYTRPVTPAGTSLADALTRQ